MFEPVVKSLELSGTIINLLGHDFQVAGYTYAPAEDIPAPYATWGEWEESAGIGIACRDISERPIRLKPGFVKVGTLNGIIPLVRPNQNQQQHISQFWHKIVKFSHGVINDYVDVKALHRRSGCYSRIVASCGPETAKHYVPSSPNQAYAQQAYVIMHSGPALVMHYAMMEELDYVLIPASFPVAEGAPRTGHAADALILAQLLVKPDAILRQCDPSMRRPEYEPSGAV